jgi:hypothetical protein
VLCPKRCGAGIKAGVQGWPVDAELVAEPVAGPHARSAAKGVLQAGMLSDQRRRQRPRREGEQGFHEASAKKRSRAKSFAPSFVAVLVQVSDQRDEFGGVENCRYVAYDRAARYLARCHRRSLSCGHAPGGSSLAGALFPCFLAKLWQGHRTASAPGGGRARMAECCLSSRRAGSDPRRDSRLGHAETALLVTIRTSECGRRDSNPQSAEEADPRSAASTSFATPALRRSLWFATESDSVANPCLAGDFCAPRTWVFRCQPLSVSVRQGPPGADTPQLAIALDKVGRQTSDGPHA